MKIAVGSKNPTKINAVKEAFQKVFPNETWIIEGIEVGSGVSDQPMSINESIRGARNRAKRAIKKLNADFGVGLEGGLHKIGKRWFDSGWMIVVNKKGEEGMGSSIWMQSPNKMMEHVFKGLELGHVDDMFFNQKNSKHGDGHFGLMTKNALTRTSAYVDGVVSALSRFIHPELYD